MFPYVLSFTAFLFAFGTMISWSCCGEQCCARLLGEQSIRVSETIFFVFVFLGAMLEAKGVTDFGAMMILGMAFPKSSAC